MVLPRGFRSRRAARLLAARAAAKATRRSRRRCTARGLELVLDHQPHRQRSCVPATRRQSPEDRVACRLLVEMKRLWVEFGGECLDPLLVDRHPPGAEGLPHGEVLEISLGQIAAFCSSSQFLSRPMPAVALTKGCGHPAGRSPPSAYPVAVSRIDAGAGAAALNRLAHRREETRDSSAIALNDRRKLGALDECHTHAVDANVAALVASAAYHELPINLNGRSLRTNDSAGHYHAGGVAPATVHPEVFAAILRKSLPIIAHKHVFEETRELPPLALATRQ